VTALADSRSISLQKARELFAARSWQDAHDAYAAADSLAPLEPADLWHLSWSASLSGRDAASFAALGDLVFAEPKALIGFAGPRTIKATIRLELPKGFQTSEFLLQHGFIDRIVPRSRRRQANPSRKRTRQRRPLVWQANTCP